MEDEKEATRICGQCNKEVAATNFALHESHCSRFLCVCPDCDENVPRSELGRHKEEQHGQVRCSKCHKKMERRHLTEHEEEDCPERLECCQFCELEMAVKELNKHTVVCGSRTERCLDCDRYVKLSEQKDHGKTCSGQNQDPNPQQGASGPLPKVKVLCKVCMMRFSLEEIKKHEVTCTVAESDSDSDDDESVDFLNHRVRNMYQDLFRPDPPRLDRSRPNGPSLGASSRDPLELSICPNCQLVLPRSTLHWHEGKCKVHTSLKIREAHVSQNL